MGQNHSSGMAEMAEMAGIAGMAGMAGKMDEAMLEIYIALKRN
jgi:hypothetical protein